MQYFVKVEENVNIYVNDINPEEKKVILFIHGWPLNNRMFEYQYNELPKYGYRCIGIDIRGFGRSDKPWENYTYDRISDDIRTVIDTLKLNNITLAGHSVGGAISIRYMARHSGYGVSKLALFGAAAPSFVERPNFPSGSTKADVDKIVQNVYENRPKVLQDFTDQFFNKYIVEPFNSWILNLAFEAAGYSTAKLMHSLSEESLFSDINKIQIPTLILHGLHDRICPIAFGEYLKNNITNSKLVVLENSGHALFWEEKDKFNKELMNFIG